MVDEKSHVAEVYHRYIADPAAAAEKEQRRAEQAKVREAEARRKEAEERSAARAAHRGAAGLRRERTAHEKLKRLRLEMEVAAERGELILRSTVEKQAGFVFISLRQAIRGFPGRYCRTMVGITDPRQAQEVLTRAAHEFLNELAGFAEKMTDPGWFQTLEGDGEPQSTEARTYQER